MTILFSFLEKFTTANKNINWDNNAVITTFLSNEKNNNNYTKLSWINGTGTFSLKYATECSIVVVGGGGSGASSLKGGGGGGGGGVSYYDSYILPADDYTITVGNGGASVQNSNGFNGESSIFNGTNIATLNITSTGGAGGALYKGGNSGSGVMIDLNNTKRINSSKIAAAPPTIENAIATGGAGSFEESLAINSSSTNGGYGGKGISIHNTLNGEYKIYGAGGGGSSYSGDGGLGGNGEKNINGTDNGAGNGYSGNISGLATNGINNTGGGGGGAKGNSISGAGGKGIVIIYFKTSNIDTKTSLSRNNKVSMSLEGIQSCEHDYDCNYKNCNHNNTATVFCFNKFCKNKLSSGAIQNCSLKTDPYVASNEDTIDYSKGNSLSYYSYIDKGKDKDTDKGKDKDTDKGKDKDTDKGKDKDTDKGKDKDTDKGKDKDTDKGKDKETDKGKDKETDKGKDKETDKGKDKDTDKGKDKDTDKGKDKGTDKGKDKGTDKGKDKGTDKGKDKGTYKKTDIKNNDSSNNYQLVGNLNTSKISNDLLFDKKNDVNKEKISYNYDISYISFILFWIVLILWFTAGLCAFIMSFVCFAYNSENISYNFMGLIMALFLGPIYWIYYAYNKKYCY